MTFGGFRDEALEFYERLAADNTKTFWAAHRDEYLREVREPMVELLAALEAEFAPGKVYRPHRDVRFSADKSPIKDHQGAFANRDDGTGWYVQISATGLMVAGGKYDPTPDQLRRYREAVADDVPGGRWQQVTDALTDSGWTVGMDLLKTRPRGVDPDHPRLDLLRVRRPVAMRSLGAPDWLGTPDCLEHVRAAWRELTPLNDWLSQHVGPAADSDR